MKSILSVFSTRVAVPALLAFAVTGCATTDGADTDPDLEAGADNGLSPQDFDAGDGGAGGAGGGDPGGDLDPGWSVEVSADSLAQTSVTDPAYSEVYVIRGSKGIQNVPLDEDIKAELLADFTTFAAGDESTVYMVSPKALEAIKDAEATGKLSPELEALSEPDDPTILGSCGNQDRTAGKSIPLSFSTSGSQNLGGGFTGTYSFSASVTGSVGLELGYRVYRKKVVFACVPYFVRANHIRAHGNVQAQKGDGIQGSLGLNYKWQKEVAKPGIGAITFMVGPIPVIIGFSLPITVGIDATATGTGTLSLQGSQVVASGGFDYTCTFSGCWGWSGISMPQQNQPVLAAGISGRIDTKVWTEVAFRTYLYSDSVAYAQVGVRPHLYGDLWSYYGNDCGDANGDGVNETVSAATFNLDWQVKIHGKAALGGGNPADIALWSGQRKHIKFWDLAGSSSALTPMIHGPASPQAGTTATYTLKMRPCWPHQDAVSGTIAWGDGGSSSAWMPVNASKVYGSAGPRTLTLTAASDAFGRNLGAGKTTSRTIQVQ
jgi:hypothetical protein